MSKAGVKTRRGPQSAATLQSAYRLLAIIEEMAALNEAAGVTELANRLDLAKSTVYRLLQMLVDCGYARQDKTTEKYQLTLKLFVIGSRPVEKLDVARIARPYLVELNNALRETVNLVARDGRHGVYIHVEEGDQEIRLYSRVGRKAPLYCTAAGKALISDLGREEVAALLGDGGWQAYTPNTHKSLDALLPELDQVRQQGYAVDNEEWTPGARCLAVPVRDLTGDVVAAISVAGPSARMEANREGIAARLLAAGREVSQQLGYLIPVTGGF